MTDLPWNFDEAVFRCTWEYPVHDFDAEVDFHTNVMGMGTIANDGVYALFTNAGGEITYAIRRFDPPADLSQHRLTLMSNNLDAIAALLKERTSVEVFEGSPVQHVVRVTTPAGIQIDIWSTGADG